MKSFNLKNGKNMLIRRAEKKDASALIDYLQVIAGESDFLTFGLGEINITLEQEEAFIENTLKAENALFLVAEIDGEIAGNLNFTGGARPRTKQTGEFGVSVLKEYWGLGIGRELINYLIDWSKNTGIVRKINLKVRCDNTRGITLYEDMGFKQEGLITREFMMDDVFYDCIVMGMEID
ncbi:GNAT family N-acetyltransferase [Alkaliphilus peptidifermentans]|uniref:Protein N-acetyltransferase, RimJ/RimL family n=1 Tax=Alkaliphilus peptidifermentans DSM 18978 TaxID=1120976 RepID=A0A1G5L6C5_9FIRM|nr:GNAT family N-acetyltransferase [Alkaliphilus peptidifermentans]SCZ08432.1 Protein N-acetyltransferase, RimJ/RimL family [Alkaliphilus peptidifermentans DSM 18978]